MAKDKLRKVGEIAPEFHLYEADGKKISLSDLLGENKYILLYFTSTEEKSRCDRSECPLKENLEKLIDYGVIPVLIDADPVEEHKKFKHEHNIKFLMLSDPAMETIKGYGVYEKVNVHGLEKEKVVSTAFLINPDGKIVHVWEPKKIEDSIDDIINAIKKLKGI
ncbi:peroxiredoxin Q/BCP [Persephonella hydrogeniphila]|uniref:Peroxiredoxin Q/BCP n=1 Tax=Persephonella hydrogeniphila TaxID=198703 RepID=A0A285NPJ9_9AQUI|nr:redoxin domain-containing protein [Persephonella hydrogeniphila]SNZ10853.1 peroxiredoxin Q/BCP [Persephonella hydrogeniphila]